MRTSPAADFAPFRPRRWPLRACALALLGAAPLAALANPAENDAAMRQLASDKGCLLCHSIDPKPRRADGLPPIAPSWREVALKYRDDPLAHKRLTQTVITGSDPKARHWSGQAGATAMPPNGATVSAEEARQLVNWLLVLVP
jgi:cytochrome c